MGIDIISFLHCISITSTYITGILYVADQSVSPNSIKNWEIFSTNAMAILQHHQSLKHWLEIWHKLAHSATWQSNPIIRCKETVTGAPENLANVP